MNNGFNVGAKFIAPSIDNSNTTADTTKQGVMNHAPTNTTERQRRASAFEKKIDKLVYALYGPAYPAYRQAGSLRMILRLWRGKNK